MRIVILASVLLLTLSGCMQNHAVIKLKADGSGSVEITDLFKKQMMEGMDPAAKAQMFSEEKSKTKAGVMGTEFVKVEPLTEGDFVGQKAYYTFKDITKLNFDALGADKPQDPNQKSEPVKISFAKSEDEHPLLKLTFPKGKEKPKPKDEPKKSAADEAAELEMTKKMLAGLRISLSIVVEGEVVKTSSEFVEGNKVTIFDMSFDGVLEKPELLKKMDETPDDPEATAKILKDVKGIKMITSNEFSLEFKQE